MRFIKFLNEWKIHVFDLGKINKLQNVESMIVNISFIEGV